MTRSRIGRAAAVAAALAWAAPAAAQGAGAEGQSGQQAQGQRGQQGQQLGEDLRKAMQELHAANQAEIRLGETAQQKAESQQVKQFAQRMVEQHQQGDRQLQQVAQQMGVQLRGKEYDEALEESREKSQDLQQKSGAEFDRAYMEFMVKDHEEDVKKVHDAAMKSAEQSRPQLAQMFGQTEATMHEHHALAQQLEGQVKQQSQQRQGSMGSGEGAGGQGSLGSGAPGSTGAGQQQEQQQEQQKERQDAMGTPREEREGGAVGGEPPRGKQ